MNLAKAAVLSSYKRDEILDVKFDTRDQFQDKTIRSRVIFHDGPQLKDYIKSAKVQQLIKEQNLELQAHLIIIVGSRHILLWDMDKDGKLVAEPRLV
jgi:hypothetical protein